MPTTTPRSRARGRGVWLVVWLIVLKEKSKRQMQKSRSDPDGRGHCRLSIFIAFISFFRGNVVKDFTGGIGTKSIVAASNRIIHQLCGFPHRGDGAITLAAFAVMITISTSPKLI